MNKTSTVTSDFNEISEGRSTTEYFHHRKDFYIATVEVKTMAYFHDLQGKLESST